MTYSIDVRPYNDHYIKIADEAIDAAAELLIAGAFLVDIIPILKYVPKWFPNAGLQRNGTKMRKHIANVRNTTFEARENWWYVIPYLIEIRSQAGGDYDSSFIKEVLREIDHFDTPIKDIDLVKYDILLGDGLLS